VILSDKPFIIISLLTVPYCIKHEFNIADNLKNEKKEGRNDGRRRHR
jgi:hypothetical protein